MTTPTTYSFPALHRSRLAPYLPLSTPLHPALPHTTLTYATSLDSTISLQPGAPTPLSSTASSSMTHYLRSVHAGILIGVGTAIADDPGLNCRLVSDERTTIRSPRPVILDPHARWKISDETKVVRLAKEGRGLPPWVVTCVGTGEWPVETVENLERVGGRYVHCAGSAGTAGKLDWCEVLRVLRREGLDSLMIEGGAGTIERFLEAVGSGMGEWGVSVVVTICPVWLGKGGVVICPERGKGRETGDRGGDGPWLGLRLKDVTWLGLGEDGVLCGRLCNLSDGVGGSDFSSGYGVVK